VSFTTPPSGEALRWSFGAASVTINGTSPPQNGFTIGLVGTGGSIHRHLNALLMGPDTSTDPADGIYFTNLRLLSSDGSIAPSSSLYIIYNNGAPEPAFQAALQYLTSPLPGDANFDGLVNLQDFNALAANFGQSDRFWYHGDFNRDRVVNLQDFNALAAHFGQSNGAGSFVPEPSCHLVLFGGAIALLARRRQRHYFRRGETYVNTKPLIIGIIASCSIATFTVTIARAEDFDVAPRVANNQITTDAFHDALKLLVDNVRVFAFEFGEIPGQPFFLPDPGFHPLPGSGFAEGSNVGFNVTSGLTYWDGSGSVNFGTVPGGETLRLALGANSVTVGNSPPVPGGFNIAAVDASGEFDEHLESFLERGGGLDPTNGIYFLSMEVNTDMSGVSTSPPLFLLYNNGLDEELLQDARVFVRDTFAPGTNLPEIPEPAMLAPLVLPAAMLSRHRHRRRRRG
jgi:hypothetical protein